jgi:hypothetical protein
LQNDSQLDFPWQSSNDTTFSFGFQGSRKESLPDSEDVSKSDKNTSSDGDVVEERIDKLEDDLHSDQVPTLAIHENSSLKTSPGRLSTNKVAAASPLLHGSMPLHYQDEILTIDDLESPDARGKNIERRNGGKTSPARVENGSFGFATRNQDNGLRKVTNFCCFLGY